LVLKRLDKRTAQWAVRFRTFSEFVPLVVAIGLVDAYVPLTACSDLRARAFERPWCALAPFNGKRAMASVSATRNSSPPRNQLLAAMSATDLALLQPHLQPVPMALLKKMERPNRRIGTVYFMENGIASVVAVQPDETRVEVGLIGREGMSGIAVVLGGDQSPHSTYIQVAGEGQRITAGELRKAMDASQTLQSLSSKCSWCRRLTPPSLTLALILTSVWHGGF
jgi:hypothetical protein